MKFIEPSVEYWAQAPGIDGVWAQIAKATRVCYQSQARDGESDKDFVKRIILKPALIEGNLDDLEHCKFDFDKMHGAMLEHGTVYIIGRAIPNYWKIAELPYTKYNKHNDLLYITTNVRVLFEHNMTNILTLFEHYTTDKLSYVIKPTKYHFHRYTFSVITDIGVTREMNRHRTFSVAEQSTRYCDFTKNKFGNDFNFPLPSWINKGLLETSEVDNCLLSDMSNDLNSATTEDINNFNIKESNVIYSWDDIDFYIYANIVAQYCYKALRNKGWRPEQARQVLPLGLKTQAVYTAFEDDWEHFLKLRADNVSGKAHPNMKIIADKIKELFNNK